MATEKRLIDANELLEWYCDGCSPKQQKICENDPVCRTKSRIIEAPTVDAVEVVHGHWKEKILVGGFAEEWGYVCSQCGCTVSDRSKLGIGRYASNNQRLNYCPNCGAKMDGERKDNESDTL